MLREARFSTSDADVERIEAAIRLTKAGDTHAFSVVVERFERPLRGWVAKYAGPGVDVDDVAQASFLTAYTRLSEYSPNTNFAAWLFTIARYQLQTETTRLRRLNDYHRRLGPDLLARELERRAATAATDDDEQFEHLGECLEELEESRRRLLDWRYDEGVPLTEIASRSGRTVAAIKKQLWLLRGQLRGCIEGKSLRPRLKHDWPVS